MAARSSKALALIAAAALAAGLTGVLAACASGSSDSPGASAGTLPPVIVQISELDGETVEVPLDNVVDLVVAEDGDVTAWSADVADESIVEFVPGKDDGSAQFNPGLTPLKVGETEVSLTDGSETVDFTVVVTE